MPNYWIFVLGARKNLRKSDDAPSVNEVLRSRLESRRWPIGERTPSRQRLRAGDRVIMYMAGEGNRTFVADAILESDLEDARDALDPDMVYAVRLGSISLWPKPVKVEPLVQRLDFISEKKDWMRRFVTGIVSIEERDFKRVLAAAGRKA